MAVGVPPHPRLLCHRHHHPRRVRIASSQSQRNRCHYLGVLVVGVSLRRLIFVTVLVVVVPSSSRRRAILVAPEMLRGTEGLFQ